MNNLSKTMQERLDKWRKEVLPGDLSKNLKIKNPASKATSHNYVARGDWGDDIRDFEAKDAAAWQRQMDANPEMYGRR